MKEGNWLDDSMKQIRRNAHEVWTLQYSEAVENGTIKTNGQVFESGIDARERVKQIVASANVVYLSLTLSFAPKASN